MSTSTINYNLLKPGINDFYNIEIHNGNMDILDNLLFDLNKDKVNKIIGKGLSTNDFTTILKNKLDGIEIGANKYIHPVNHSLDIISETNELKIMTNVERIKLAGVAAGATKYSHPLTHDPSIIKQDTNNRFSTDTEKTRWNKVDDKVDKILGKGLSKNDYSDLEKQKVEDNKTNLGEHVAENVTQDNVHGLRGKCILLGEGSSALNAGTGSTDGAVVIGYNARVDYDNFDSRGSVAIGKNAKSVGGFYQIALGENAETNNAQSGIAIGTDSTVTKTAGIAIGRDSKANGGSSLAIGLNTLTEGSSSVAIGRLAESINDSKGVFGSDGGLGRITAWEVCGDFSVSGTKNFEIPHPKPEKMATHKLRHGAVESPTTGDTLYRHTIESTKENDMQLIELPDYFIYLNKDVQIWVTGQGHFGNGYGELNVETEQLEIHCQLKGEYNILVIGTRNDNHQSVQNWDIKGVEREIGESWMGETYAFSVDEIMEVEEIKEGSA